MKYNKYLYLLIGLSFLLLSCGTRVVGTIGDQPVNVAIVGPATQVRTPTNTATNTPTRTVTPTATRTPTATVTSTATATNTSAVPTPTPEQGNGTTPTPVLSATPLDESKCWAGIAATTLNVRSNHTLTATKLGTVLQSDKVEVLRLYIVRDAVEEWAYIIKRSVIGTITIQGWIAITIPNGTVIEHYAVLDDSDPCWDIEKIYATDPIPTPALTQVRALMDGIHVLAGGNSANTVFYADKFKSMKCLSGSGDLCLTAKANNPQLFIIYRSLLTCRGMIDGPQADQWNGETWYACVRPNWLAGYDYYEYVNEIGTPFNDFSLLARFSIEFATAAARDGFCTLAFSFSPGVPELNYWDNLYAYLAWANTHPCGTWPDGTPKYHGIALHQSSYLPSSYTLRNGSWINNIWISGRDRMIEERLNSYSNFSLKDFKGPIIISEVGLHDGYSGSPTDVWSCQDAKSSYQTTITQYKDYHPWIDGFSWWNFGTGGSKWTDLSPCLVFIYG
jgi:hypothetical protein